MTPRETTRAGQTQRGNANSAASLTPSEQLGWDPRDRELRIVGSNKHLNVRHVLEQSI